MDRLIVVTLFALAAACSNGSSGGGGPSGPPGPPYAQTSSTGLAVSTSFQDAAALGALVLAPISESEMGADLNGDGDMTDKVLHEIDTGTDIVTNLMLAITGPVLVSDAQFAFLVVEAAQAGTDLNGDGDSADAVWFAYDPALAVAAGVNPINTGLATPSTGLPGAATTGGFVMLVSEAAGGADRNGDGDLSDNIPMVFEGSNFGVSAAVVPAHASGRPLVARAGRVLLASSEASAAADLNGDGDQTDVTLGYVDFTLGLAVFRNTGVTTSRAVASHPYALTDGAAVYFIDEASEAGTDFNGDGDTLDAIIAVFNIAGGGLQSLPTHPTIPALALAGATQVGIGAGSNRVIVAIDEASEKGRDLNNDFDSIDFILAWIDTANPAALNITSPRYALASRAPVIDGTRGLVAVSEAQTTFFGVDLNNDGDTTDNVAHILDATAPPGLMINLSVAAAGMSLIGNDAIVGVPEAFQGGIDFNNNGVSTDIIQFFFDLGDTPHTSRSLGVISPGLTFHRTAADELRIAAILPEGQSPSFNDLNKDGDQLDNGLELITLDAGANPPTLVQPTPFGAGTASSGVSPPIRIGDDIFVFATEETMQGTDLNNDGDTLDTVICCTRILPPDP